MSEPLLPAPPIESAPPRLRAVVNAVAAEERLETALRSLASALTEAAAPAEVVVVLVAGEARGLAAAERAGAVVRLLAPGEARTPGACRNRGAEGARAEFLLLLDGDVDLDPAFLRRALGHLDANPGCAAYAGRLDERHWRHGRQVGGAADLYGVGAGGETKGMGAAWVCRRAAFESVGGFDPRLPSEEDFELCLRLRQRGHTLWADARLAGHHDCGPRPSLAELGRRWRRGLYAGQGLALRKHWGGPGFGELMTRQRLFFGALLFWALGLVALGAALAGRPLALATWLGAGVALWLAQSLRKHSVRVGALSLLTWSVQGVAVLRSLLFGPWGEMVDRRAVGGGR